MVSSFHTPCDSSWDYASHCLVWGQVRFCFRKVELCDHLPPLDGLEEGTLPLWASSIWEFMCSCISTISCPVLDQVFSHIYGGKGNFQWILLLSIEFVSDIWQQCSLYSLLPSSSMPHFHFSLSVIFPNIIVMLYCFMGQCSLLSSSIFTSKPMSIKTRRR